MESKVYCSGHFVLKFFILQVVVNGETNIMYPEAQERQIESWHFVQPEEHWLLCITELSMQYDPFCTSDVSVNPDGQLVRHFPLYKE